MNTLFEVNFWKWFFFGAPNSEGKPGWVQLWDPSFFIHVLIAIALGMLCDKKASDVSVSALLPLAGVLIGLTFAWATNVQSILQSKEWKDTIDRSKFTIEDYVFEYVSAILVILITMGLWGLAAIGIFDKLLPGGTDPEFPAIYRVVLGSIFFFTTCSMHLCWKVVSVAQMKLVSALSLGSLHTQRDALKGEVLSMLLAAETTQAERAESEEPQKVGRKAA